MSEIREKIMAIEPPDQFCHNERFGFNFAIGYAAAAAEAEAQRLEARVKELVDVVKYLTEDMALNNGDRELVDRVLGGE